MPQDINEKSNLYYSALLNAWFTTHISHSKSLLTIAGGGTAVLVTLLTTVGIASLYSGIFLVLAIVCFLITIFSVIKIYNLNTKRIQLEISYLKEKINVDNSNMNKVERKIKKLKKSMKFRDSISQKSLMVGVILSLLFGITNVKINMEDYSVSNKGEENNTEKLSPEQKKQLSFQKSFLDMEEVRLDDSEQSTEQDESGTNQSDNSDSESQTTDEE